MRKTCLICHRVLELFSLLDHPGTKVTRLFSSWKTRMSRSRFGVIVCATLWRRDVTWPCGEQGCPTEVTLLGRVLWKPTPGFIYIFSMIVFSTESHGESVEYWRENKSKKRKSLWDLGKDTRRVGGKSEKCVGRARQQTGRTSDHRRRWYEMRERPPKGLGLGQGEGALCSPLRYISTNLTPINLTQSAVS